MANKKLKKSFRALMPRRILRFFQDIFYPEKIDLLEERLKNLFLTRYEDISSPTMRQKIQMKNSEFKVFSKHGCDGILLHIFSKIGTHNHTFVEMGIQDGTECNAANLAINFGWKGLFLDAEHRWVMSASKYFKEMTHGGEDIRVVESFVTAENINSTLKENSITGEIDLLSIDIDSNDYWVWKAIKEVNPRVVVVEYNAAYGPSRAMTMKYDSKFHYKNSYKKYPLYFGASLKALTKLGREKGYILVCTDSNGHDAYFVRKDVARGKFIDCSPESSFYPNPYNISHIGDTETQFNTIKHLNFEEV
jgi:hypothetical protein